MQTVTDALRALNAITAPAVLVSACGLLLLGMYPKYSRIVASLRSLNGELREGREGWRGNADHAYRERQIESECGLLLKRLRNVLAQVMSVATAMTLFLLASLTIAGSMLLHVEMASLAVVFVTIGITALIAAMGLATAEARFIWEVVRTELAMPAASAESSHRSIDGSGISTHAKGQAQ
jgi:hypothetical protein